MPKSPNPNDAAAELCRRLGYAFRDPGLLDLALTHRSKGGKNNERLEFLGDSILSFVISAELYERFPGLDEGDLTRMRSRLVKRETLAQLARALGLGPALKLGGGELKSGGFDRDSILADALEAVFGAVHQDADLDAARGVILRVYRGMLSGSDLTMIEKDPKTRLQEYLQQRGLPLPVYEIRAISGEPHDQSFTVECSVPGLSEPVRAQGSSRRNAEQEAAARALALLTLRVP